MSSIHTRLSTRGRSHTQTHHTIQYQFTLVQQYLVVVICLVLLFDVCFSGEQSGDGYGGEAHAGHVEIFAGEL